MIGLVIGVAAGATYYELSNIGSAFGPRATTTGKFDVMAALPYMIFGGAMGVVVLDPLF